MMVKTICALALGALVVGCHLDKLVSGSGGPHPTSTAPPVALVFTVQPPSTVLLGASFQAQVAALDDQGNVVPTFTGSVSIRIASGVGGSLSGTTQVNAVGGYATFSDLHINSLIGTYTLGVSGGGLTGATSNSILVVAGIGLP